MKCAACGYQYVYKSVMVDEIDYFKSGKRKGEIKGTKGREIEFQIGHTEFKKLVFKKDVDTLGVTNTDYYSGYFEEVDLYVCPDCGTVRVGELR